MQFYDYFEMLLSCDTTPVSICFKHNDLESNVSMISIDESVCVFSSLNQKLWFNAVNETVDCIFGPCEGLKILMQQRLDCSFPRGRAGTSEEGLKRVKRKACLVFEPSALQLKVIRVPL